MANSSKVQEGWDFIIKSQTATSSSFIGTNYVNTVDKAVQQLKSNINAQAGTIQGIG